MRVNPILNKEITIGARSVKLPIIVMLYNTFLACAALMSLSNFRSSYQISYNFDYGDLTSIFMILGWIQCFLVCFMVPILTGGAIAGERERQTLDIMLTTDIKSESIVTGKLLSSLLIVFLLIFSSIPILSVAFIFGGMDWLSIIYFTMIILYIAIFLGSIGIFCSCLFKKTTIAIVLTYIIGLILVLGTFYGLRVIYESLGMSQYDLLATTNQPYDMGGSVLLLLLNPGVTFYEFMQNTIGGSNVASFLYRNFGVGQKTWVYHFANSYWLITSIVLQLSISFILLKSAARMINPLKSKRKVIWKIHKK